MFALNVVGTGVQCLPKANLQVRFANVADIVRFGHNATHRNKYMAESADIVIVYIKRDYGGAYQAYKHALKENKRIFNIAKAT